jgi:crotonobetaine/carnitine-CoA ligase
MRNVEMTQLSTSWVPGEEDTVNDAFRRAVESHGNGLFLDTAAQRFTYREMDREVNRLATGLREAGVRAGETVTTILDSTPDALIAWLAINRLGAISVPVNTALRGEFLRHQLADSGSAVVIAESDYATRILGVQDGLPALKLLLHRGVEPPGPAASVKLASLDDYRLEGGDDIDVPVLPQDIASLIFTSGTTGPSKACMVSHNYMCNVARLSLSGSLREQHEMHWTPLPLFHLNAAATAVLTSIQLGGAVSLYPRFSLSGFWADIERSGAQVVTVLGAMVPLIAKMDTTPEMERCYGQIRVARGRFTAEMSDIWKERFGVQSAGGGVYGLTEASYLTYTPYDATPPRGASGRRHSDFDVRIVNDKDEELPANEPGEIVCRPLKPHVMFEGYWGRPEATTAVSRNLWFHTGDIGTFDEDGWFYFVDRKKDYFRRRGENISSYEMESTFTKHPDLQEVAVHAVPSDLVEDEVKVTAVRRPGASLTEEELCRWAIDQLPYFAIPRFIEFRDELPQGPTGKSLKYLLRDQGVTPATWDRETADVKFEKR